MTDYLNNSNKNDINRINKQYYGFLRNIYNGKNFEQQQDFNNFFNLINKENNKENDKENDDEIEENNNEIDKDIKILLKTKRELQELNKERCSVIKTDHSEDFKNINNKLFVKKIVYICIIFLILYYFLKNV